MERGRLIARLPAAYTKFTRRFPGVARLHEQVGEAAAGASPLDERTAHPVKLGMGMAERSEGAVHAHARRAL